MLISLTELGEELQKFIITASADLNRRKADAFIGEVVGDADLREKAVQFWEQQEDQVESLCSKIMEKNISIWIHHIYA